MSKLKIEYIDIDKLIPYVNNPRVNDGAVDKVASSIKNFGFKNPIIIDKDNEIIAGHTRLKAARKLGLDEVPTIKVEDLSPSYKKNGVKDCMCEDCGTEFTVRKDTKPKVCRHCTSIRGGKATKGIRTAQRVKCLGCDELILISNKNNYCSIECRGRHNRIKRVCKQCNQEFTILKSTISDKTNSTGNFCSRNCYNNYMAIGDYIKGRGSRWNKTRKEILDKFPFCAICGTTKNLQIHHITPYRLTHDNSKENLIPLCTKHHKWIEMMFCDTERFGTSKTTGLIWNSILRERQTTTAIVIKQIIDTNNENRLRSSQSARQRKCTCISQRMSRKELN